MKNLKLELGGIAIAFILTTLILMLMFSGCEYDYAPEGKFVVNEINQSRYTNYICNYHVKEGDLVFKDSCGKWNIGDTIIIKW